MPQVTRLLRELFFFFFTMTLLPWAGLKAYSKSGCSPACWRRVRVCAWTCSNTPRCQATVHNVCLLTYMADVSLLHLYQGKCDVGFCGEMSTYYGIWPKASETWACKLHGSILTHTHSYTPLLWMLREKYNFMFVLEASAPVSPHSHTARKSHFTI